MAEERLIDDDLNKDKKYRIRKNADGEDELYIDETHNEEELETIGFDVPEFAEDDEDAAIMTPEQLAAREEARREEDERRKNAVENYIEKAKACLQEPDYESALFNLNSAGEIDGKNGTVNYLKLRTLTRDFTDYVLLDECVETAEQVKEYCSAEQKKELCELSAPLQQNINALEEQAAQLHVEVEEKKAERREVFVADRKRTITWFTVTALPCLVCLIVALAFGSMISVRLDNTNLILTIVFAALAGLFFIATLFTAHNMWEAMRKVSLNEKNSSTQLGRDYEELLERIGKLNTVLHSFKEN